MRGRSCSTLNGGLISFDGDDTPSSAIRLYIANNGHRPVQIDRVGHVFASGVRGETPRAEGLPLRELSDGTGRAVWLMPPDDQEVERLGWPTRIWAEDATGRRPYDAPYPTQGYRPTRGRSQGFD